MASVALIARVLLAVVFATAGTAKLMDLKASRDTVAAFGMPDALARIGGTLLPFAELAAAVALLPQASARYGAVAALALLVVFSSGVGYALSQGRTPDCNCFGQVSSEQISWRTLARNAALVVIAAFAVWKAPGSSLSAWTTSHATANLVASIAVVALALVAVVALRYQQLTASLRQTIASGGGDPDRSVEGLPVGALAPEFTLPDLHGTPVALSSLRERGLPVLLVFASTTCGPCIELMPNLSRWSAALSDSLTIAVVESGIVLEEQIAAMLHPDAHQEVLTVVEEDRDLALKYLASVTPTAVLVTAEGRIARPQAQGSAQIEALVRQALRRQAEDATARSQQTVAV